MSQHKTASNSTTIRFVLHTTELTVNLLDLLAQTPAKMYVKTSNIIIDIYMAIGMSQCVDWYVFPV